MGITNYYSVEGEMVGDNDGVSRTDYCRDALGNVVRSTANFRYKPYGQWLTVPIGVPLPLFGWIGSYGYMSQGTVGYDVYVRARHFTYATARWTTVDPLWPQEPAYTYVRANPTNWIDPTGMQGVKEKLPNLDWGPIPHVDLEPDQLEQLKKLFESVAAQQGIQAAKAAVLARLAALGIPITEATLILLTIIALVDLGRWALTGQQGPITGVGCRIGDQLGEDQNSYETFMASQAIPTRYIEPTTCQQAKRQVTRLCKGGKLPGCGFPASIFAKKDHASRRYWCLVARQRMYAFADCIRARRAQDRLCPARPGHPKPPGGADAGHAKVEVSNTNGLNKCSQAMRKLNCRYHIRDVY
jgi:RHS repeat-associated protein